MKKFIGKPYAGKPHVRIDEGAGKVLLSFPLYSTGFVFKLYFQTFWTAIFLLKE
jgi:hypothetical protein